MRKTLSPAFLILLGILILLVGCSSGDEGPSAQPSFTAPPEDRGSAVLVYELSAEQKSSGLKASSSIGIPILIEIDPDNTKDQARIEGSTLADYYVRLGGMDRGKMCFIEFTYLVEYEVKGNYNPDPKCDFDIQVTAKVIPDEIVRSGDCSAPLHDSYPAEVLFIPPPPGLHKIPGSLPVVPIRDDGEVKITLELKNVVVPASSGCFFGG